jgi:transcriptional regulator with XRE-family HTH domain
MLKYSINTEIEAASIGLFVKTNRVRLGLTQAQLAVKVSTSQQMISTVERGQAAEMLLTTHEHLFDALKRVLSVTSQTDSATFEEWRRLVFKEMDRQLADEDLRPNVYSRNLLTAELVALGCGPKDVANIVRGAIELQGILAVDATICGQEANYLVRGWA